MVTVAVALLAIGYTLAYVAGSNLVHGPGHGVGFLEALGFPGSGASTAASSAQTAPASGSRPPAPGPTRGGNKPKPGTTTTGGGP